MACKKRRGKSTALERCEQHNWLERKWLRISCHRRQAGKLMLKHKQKQQTSSYHILRPQSWAKATPALLQQIWTLTVMPTASVSNLFQSPRSSETLRERKRNSARYGRISLTRRPQGTVSGLTVWRNRSATADDVRACSSRQAASTDSSSK